MAQEGGEKKPEEGHKLLIPPFLKPEELLREERKARSERRLRVKAQENVDEGKAMVNPDIAKELSLSSKVELVLVGGGSRERRYVFDVVLNDKVPRGEVWCNPNDMRKYGIANNSIATVRAPRGG